MITYLMQFDLTISYIRGSRNVTPDFLSRLCTDVPEQERLKHDPKNIQEEDDFLFAVSTRASARRAQADANQQSDDLASTDSQSDITDDVAGDTNDLGPNTDLYEDNDEERQTSEGQSTDLIEVPTISATDYENDEEFKHIYKYLITGDLSGDDKIDRTTLLLRYYFIWEQNALYRMETPRKMHLARLTPLRKRLCIPLKFRHGIISFMHDNCGHFAFDKLYLSLSSRYYWRTLYVDARDFCRTCATCLKSKPDFRHRAVPLHPIPPLLEGVASVWSIDHKPLVRKTKLGHSAILVCVENWTNWPVLIPVIDQSAEVTARAFVKHIIATFGFPSKLFCDKHASYLSTFFSKICALLGIKHRTSATLTARSNGLAEAMVKRLIGLLKVYANDDISIEDQLPIIELSLRATPGSRLQLSPHHLLFGREMKINAPGDTSLIAPFTGDKETYYCWLAREVKRLHAAVRERKLQIKEEDKRAYDKAECDHADV